MNEIRHKCGICGWLFRFTTNFVDHECFKDYVEGIDFINIHENYIVTMVRNLPVTNNKGHLNELLIEAVRSKRGLYDFRLPVSERTMLRKNALWLEVSNMLQGSLSPEEAKVRRKYLRDDYIKARKKVRAYVPSGSGATAVNATEKSKFQYYELMTFLNDSLQIQPTVNSLADANSINKEETSTRNEQYNDVVAESSMTLPISLNKSRTSTPTKILHTSTSHVSLCTLTPTKGLSFEKEPVRTLPSKHNII